MKKIIVIAFIIVLAVAAIVYLNRTTTSDKTSDQTSQYTTGKFESISANFEIYTFTTKRIFTDAKYHNQSENVYIEALDPSKIIVRSPNITWSDFFATLPMKLTKDCLTTGTGQVFCTGEPGTLKFFINGAGDPNALEKEINEGDLLKVIFE